MAELTPALRRRIMLTLAVAVAAVAFALDAEYTERAVAPVPPFCEIVSDPGCNDQFSDRLQGAYELEDGLSGRYSIYAVTLILAVLGIAAFGPRGEGEGEGDVLDDVGITGVAWLALGALVLLSTQDGLVDAPTQPVIGSAILFVVAGAVGRLLNLRRSQPTRAAGPLGPVVPIAGLGLVVIAVLLATIVLISEIAQGECGTEDSAWVEVAREACVVAGISAAILGLVSLAGRRWIAALACITVGPIAALIALLAGACLS